MFVTGPKVVEVCQFSRTAYGTVSERNHMSNRELACTLKSLLVEIHCLLISLFPGSDKGSGDYSRVGWGSGAHQKVRYMCGSPG